ncbi:NACHT and WD domain-containing protein [Seiridium cupressi]
MFHRKLFSSSKHRRAPTPEPDTETGDASRSQRSRSLDTEVTLVENEGSNIPSHRANSDVVYHNENVPDIFVSSVPLVSRSKLKADRTADPLGLTLIYTPDGPHSVDIVFIHGLGGSSRLTWSKNHDLDLFWPLRWLPSDHDVQSSRIFTFGYNADYRSNSQGPTLGISDFARNLLFDMVYGRDMQGQSLRLGETPLLVVAHSMGGLVFKKAFLEAQLDSRYASIAKSMKAVIFLATPHRGADLSGILNRLLSISFRGSKQYVTELSKHGSFLRTVNEQFRHIADRLEIFSFYETLQTSLGVSSSMVLEEESAKLGYPGEISRSLNADHHGVCKFDSPHDVNYRAVLGALKSTIASLSDRGKDTAANDMEKIKMLLSISGHSDHDLSLFSSRRADGTCSSILDESQIHAWVAHSPKTHVLWLHSRPARGKSVFSSFLVDHLRDQGASVQYFFFQSGDETKRSVGTLLRSLAFQIAGIHPVFRQALASLSDGGFKPKDTDWKSTWRKLFTGLLFKQESERPLYWVIDGLDECATPQLMLELTAELKTSLTPIRVLLTSRWSPALFTSFGRINSKVPSSWFSLDKNSTDMRIFIEEELQYLSWDDSVKDEVMSKILSQANDNFLWVRLILEEIKDCHTDDDVRYALNELPPGMESLYQRMEEAISRIRKPSDKNLSRQLLMWAVYARRPVSLDELSEVLEPEFGRVLDLPTTINRLCGHFLVVEGDNRLGLLHQTTREYLMSSNGLPFSLSASNCHNELFQKSLPALMVRGVRSKVQSDSSKSLHYRATTWMHHLKAATSPSDHDGQLDLLVKFFTQPCVLAWVQLLASLSQLRTLIDAAHALDSFVKKRRADAAREPAQRRFEDLELLDLWSRDLLKLPGKFGAILLQEPTSIHSSVAPFCPTKSAVYKTFGSLSSSPSIKGLSEDWDDCLARVSVGSEHQAVLLGCSAKHLAVADSAGFVSLWDCATFHRTRLLTLGEGISALCFSEVGDQIATYGYRATKVWNTQSGRLLNVIDNPSDMKAVTLHFADDGRTLLVGTDRRCLLKVSLQKEKGAWDTVNPIMLNDTESLEGTILAYRRFPLTIWNLSPAKILKRVNRDSRASASASPFVTSLAWHPNSEEVVGIFMDGYIFKTNVIEDTYNEQPPDPGQFPLHIRVSPDGTTFAICGVHGTIKLYDYQTSTLIYQLTSEENVADLCFSQDGRRFYDIRGSSCNIWEPNALIRLAATEEHPASSQSPEESVEQSNLASESFADNPTPIVIMSPMPHHSLICLGDDEGLVTLHDYDSGQRLRIDRIATGMAIEHLVWSGDACHFVYAEVGGRLTVVKPEKTSTGWKHQRIARFKPKSPGGGIKQLLLSPNSNFMLIGFQESAQIWSVDPPSQMKGSDEPRPKRHGRWVTHPTSSSHFLSIMTNRVSMHAWENTSISSEWPIGQADLHNTTTAKPPLEREDTDGNPLNNDHIQEAVEKVVPTFYRGIYGSFVRSLYLAY